MSVAQRMPDGVISPGNVPIYNQADGVCDALEKVGNLSGASLEFEFYSNTDFQKKRHRHITSNSIWNILVFVVLGFKKQIPR